jgi:uncharacterized protein
MKRGHSELARVRRAIGPVPRGATIKGEHSGDMLRLSEPERRRIGRARFDGLGLIWDHDAAVLRRLKMPLLWVLAADDREAPIAATREILLTLIADAYLFLGTDHGMVEYRIEADGMSPPSIWAMMP